MVIPRPVVFKGAAEVPPPLDRFTGLVRQTFLQKGREKRAVFPRCLWSEFVRFLLCRRRRHGLKAAVGPFFRRMGLAAGVAGGLVVGRWPPRLGQAGLEPLAKRAKA
jgi:hypothetical protein